MIEIGLLVVFPLLMAYAASSDLFTMTIPNTVAIALVCAFAAMAVAAGLPIQAILMHLAAGGCMLVATFAMFALGWIGGGDAKLAAASALWLGFAAMADYLLLAAIGGGLLSLAILAMRQVPLPSFAARWNWLSHLHDKSTGIPYGIALAGSALLVYPHTEIFAAALTR